MNFASNPDERGSSPEDASYTDSVMMDSINEANESSSKAPVSDDEDDVVDTAGPLPPFLKSPTPTERVKDGKPISLLRIFVIGSLISGAVLAVIFLMNAIVMIFGFYNLYVSFLNTMDIASIKVSGLDTLKANVSFLSSFQPGYLAQLVKFSVDKPVRLQILIPDFIHKSTRNPPIATIVIPAFKLERAQSELAFESVTFHINENIPVNDIIKWYQSREESNKYLKIRGDIPVSTWSFLFPFQYTYHYDGMIPLSSSSLKKSGPPVASIESLEFFDNKQDEDTLRADVGIKISSKVFPKYLSFDLPSFQFGVNHFLDLQYASEFLQIRTMETSFQGDEEKIYKISVEIDKHHQVKLKKMLEMIRDRRYNFEVSIQGTKDIKDSASNLQKWLATLDVHSSVDDLMEAGKPKRVIKMTSSEPNHLSLNVLKESIKSGARSVSGYLGFNNIDQGGEQEFKMQEQDKGVSTSNIFMSEPEDDDQDPVSIGLTAVDKKDLYIPRIIFMVSFSTKFIYQLFHVNLSNIKGRIPKIRLENWLERDLVSTTSLRKTELCSIDIAHEPSAAGKGPSSTIDFKVTIGLENVKDLVLVQYKINQLSKSKNPSLSQDLLELKKILITGSDINVLSSIVSVFEIEWVLAKKGFFGFTHGKKYRGGLKEKNDHSDGDEAGRNSGDDEGFSWDEEKTVIQWEIDENRVKAMKHSFSSELSSTNNVITLQGQLKLDKKPSISYEKNPYVRLKWENIELDCYPTEDAYGGDDLVQRLFRLFIERGSFRMSMASLHPGLLAHRGGIKFLFEMNNSKSELDNTLSDGSLVTVWKYMYDKWYNEEKGPDYEVVLGVGRKSIKLNSYLPPRKSIIPEPSSREDRAVWIESMIRSQVSLFGIKSGALQVLIDLPYTNFCTHRSKNPKLSFEFDLKLPAFGINICVDESVIEKKRNERIDVSPIPKKIPKRCLFKVGISAPVILHADFMDGRFCEIKTRFELDHENAKEYKRRHRRKMEKGDHPIGTEKNVLVNAVPAFVSVLDLDDALSIIPDFWALQMNKYDVTTGYLALDDGRKDDLLLETFLNGFLTVFPEYLPRLGSSETSVVHNFVSKVINEDIVLKTTVDSTDRNSLSVQFEVSLPEKCFPKLPATRRDDDLREVSRMQKMMSIDWGDIDIYIRRNKSFVRIRIGEGSVSLPKQSESDAHKQYFHISRKLTLCVDIFAGLEDVNSASVFNLKNYFIAAVNKGKIGEQMPEIYKAVSSVFRKMPFTVEIQAKEPGASNREKSNTKRGNSNVNEEGEVEIGYQIKKTFNGSFLLHLFQLLGHKDLSKVNNVPSFDYEFVFTPSPFEDMLSVTSPYLFPENTPPDIPCLQTPKDRRFALMGVEVKRLVMQLALQISNNLSSLLKKLVLESHPAGIDMHLIVFPPMALQASVNYIDLAEIRMKPFEIHRRVSFDYSFNRTRSYTDYVADHVKNDTQPFMAEVRFGKHMKDFGDIIHPFFATLSSGFSPNIHALPTKAPYELYYSPMAISFSTVSNELNQLNLLSSLFCAWYGEHPISPMISRLGTGPSNIDVKLSKVMRDELVVDARHVRLPWPVPKMSILVPDPVVLEYEFRGHSFLRVFLKRGLYISYDHVLIDMVKVVISKTGFGALPVDRYSLDFVDLMNAIVFGRPIDILVHVNIGTKFRVDIPMYFSERPAKLSIFDTANSEVDLSAAGKELLSALLGETNFSPERIVNHPILKQFFTFFSPSSALNVDNLALFGIDPQTETPIKDIVEKVGEAVGINPGETSLKDIVAKTGAALGFSPDTSLKDIIGDAANILDIFKDGAKLEKWRKRLMSTDLQNLDHFIEDLMNDLGISQSDIHATTKVAELFLKYVIDSPEMQRMIKDLREDETKDLALRIFLFKIAKLGIKMYFPKAAVTESKVFSPGLSIGERFKAAGRYMSAAAHQKMINLMRKALKRLADIIAKPGLRRSDNWIDFHTTVEWVIYWGLKPSSRETDPTRWAIYAFANLLNDKLIGKVPPISSSTSSHHSSSSPAQYMEPIGSSNRSITGQPESGYGGMLVKGIKSFGQYLWDFSRGLLGYKDETSSSSDVGDAASHPSDFNFLGEIQSDEPSTSRWKTVSNSSDRSSDFVSLEDDESADSVPFTDHLNENAPLPGMSSGKKHEKIFDKRAYSETSVFSFRPAVDLKNYFKKEAAEIQGKTFESTFTTEDMLDERLEDMVWLGTGSAGLRGMFLNNPQITKAASGILEHMTRNYYFQKLMRLYKISFKNDSDFHLAIVGQVLNLSFKDVDGLTNSKIENILQIKPKPEVNAKMHLLPKACEWPFGTVTPNLVSILRCIHHNVNEPAVMLRPGTHMLGDERYVGKIEMEGADLIQLADENFSHGRCMTIKESQVVVAIFEPDHYENFFLINLNLSVPEQADPNDEHDDPCGTLFACIPTERGFYAHSLKIWNQNSGRLSQFSLDASSLAFSQSILVDFPSAADSFVLNLWDVSSRILLGRVSFFTKKGKPMCEIVQGKTTRKRNFTSSLLGSRLILRVNIFEKTLQICKEDLSFCTDFNIENDLKSLGQMEASFIFYSYDSLNFDHDCDVENDPYKCISTKAGERNVSLEPLTKTSMLEVVIPQGGDSIELDFVTGDKSCQFAKMNIHSLVGNSSFEFINGARLANFKSKEAFKVEKLYLKADVISQTLVVFDMTKTYLYAFDVVLPSKILVDGLVIHGQVFSTRQSLETLRPNIPYLLNPANLPTSGLIWQTEFLDPNQFLVCSFMFEIHGSANGDEDEFGLVWKVMEPGESYFNNVYDQGRTISVKIKPSSGKLIIWDGIRGQAIYQKESSAFPTSITSRKLLLKAWYDPAEKGKLALIFENPADPSKHHSSSYVFNFKEVLGIAGDEKPFLGIFAHFQSNSKFTFSNWEYYYVLPDLWRTELFYTTNSSPLPGQDYIVLLHLRNECGHRLHRAALGLLVDFWPIETTPVYDKTHPCSVDYVWRKEKVYPKWIAPRADLEFQDSDPDSFDFSKGVPVGRRTHKVNYVRHVNEDFYEVSATFFRPGRYRIMQADEKWTTRFIQGGATDFDGKNSPQWIPVRNAHVYVRNYQ